jgi:hypothetical protein
MLMPVMVFGAVVMLVVVMVRHRASFAERARRDLILHISVNAGKNKDPTIRSYHPNKA